MLENVNPGKASRYLGSLLIAVFMVNLLINSSLLPFYDGPQFLDSVEQFVTLLLASGLIAVEFILVKPEPEEQSS